MIQLKLIQIGNSVGVVLPKEVLGKLKAGKGDTLFASETEDGVRLSAYDPAVAEQVESGREFMREFRDTFRALAK